MYKTRNSGVGSNITAAVSVVKRDAGDNGRVWREVGGVVASATTPEQNRALA